MKFPTSSADSPGSFCGSIKTNGGEVLIRTKGQAYVKEDYADLVILSRPDGTRLRLGDIATITDDFDETPIITKFNGQPALTVEVYRIGDQNAITVAAAVRKYIAEKSILLPEGILWKPGGIVPRRFRHAYKHLPIVPFKGESLFCSYWDYSSIPLSPFGFA